MAQGPMVTIRFTIRIRESVPDPGRTATLTHTEQMPFIITNYCCCCYSLIPSRVTGHHPDLLQEAPHASWITLVLKVGPRLSPSLLMHWAV